MEKQELYSRLVDLYAGNELPQELKDELEAAAMNNPSLSHDMMTLTATVNALREGPQPEFTSESFHRVLMKMYAAGVEVKPISPEPVQFQLRLPMIG